MAAATERPPLTAPPLAAAILTPSDAVTVSIRPGPGPRPVHACLPRRAAPLCARNKTAFKKEGALSKSHTHTVTAEGGVPEEDVSSEVRHRREGKRAGRRAGG